VRFARGRRFGGHQAGDAAVGHLLKLDFVLKPLAVERQHARARPQAQHAPHLVGLIVVEVDDRAAYLVGGDEEAVHGGGGSIQ